jgi:hypothetical protein
MVGANGQVHKVKCKIYNKIEGHDKFMELKLIICANMLNKK